MQIRAVNLATFIAIAAGATLAGVPGSAQDARQPDPRHGAIIAAQGTANVPACAQCHAFNGASDSSGAFPRLTGQPVAYLTAQMRDFASSLRDSAIMSPIAKGLSPADRADVAAYFAAAEGPFPVLAGADAATIKRGEKIAREGDEAKGLQACNNCHGPDGAGFPPQIPYLAGQYGDYIKLALNMWKSGFRKNSPHAMKQVADRLDDQDIAAVAAFYQHIRNDPETTSAR
ncbi:c-type cytochrome [Bradyrhizobium sp. Arg237L]|uniref:c-type cytochrome n=1 Tax=Bradyrhizobium sp. Arg237L TaxID=3003352 RepID=UPI00249DC426|nr:c-type cytochrome [Bradyrhizobium sp. Arg237L]MDI4239076.1 c-type cytochrome [Bradyrhizobium sp. Arg237L]